MEGKADVGDFVGAAASNDLGRAQSPAWNGKATRGFGEET